MDDEKLVDLESRIAYQDHTIAALNDALVAQQARMTALADRVDALTERVLALSRSQPGDGPQDEKPPHY